jgi:hypothetical protein
MFWMFKCCRRTGEQRNPQALRSSTHSQSKEDGLRTDIQKAIEDNNYLLATQLLMEHKQAFEISSDEHRAWSSFLNVSTFTSPYQIIMDQSTVLNLQILPGSKKGAYPAYAYLMIHQKSLVLIGINALYMEEDDIELLLHAMTQQSHVKTFMLKDIVTMTSKMVSHLAMLLSDTNSSLTCFSFDSKEMSDTCAETIAQSLVLNDTLEVLALNNITLSSSPIKTILEGLLGKETLGALIQVNLEGSTVDAEALAMIEQLQLKHPGLEIIKPKTANNLSI